MRSRVAISIAILATGGVVAGLVQSVWRHRPKSIVMRGAVIKRDADVNKQSPIANVQVSVQGAGVPIVTETNFSGFFQVALPNGARSGEFVVLQFRHPDYQRLDAREIIGNQLYIISLVPVAAPKRSAVPTGPPLAISNVRVRYSTQIQSEADIGSEVTTFEVKNQGNVPCNGNKPCSPDGKWQAHIGSATLDAGQGNVFENARVSCIAGPCPFTRIVNDQFSNVARQISVSVLGWSDTTTFLIQGEVFRREIIDSVRELYPVHFGDSINFTLPPPAEGPSFEVEINSVETVFPLSPSPTLPWANCNVQLSKNRSRSYRCELKPGYAIVSH
ncbi:MAG: carboxypeptidase regulatory-like domain-containing protein [Acidobacteriota bacterium]|nr:carboxypeptidase regulatory-like domain-containing protein [Acidobacteriota bacterium]